MRYLSCTHNIHDAWILNTSIAQPITIHSIEVYSVSLYAIHTVQYTQGVSCFSVFCVLQGPGLVGALVGIVFFGEIKVSMIYIYYRSVSLCNEVFPRDKAFLYRD